MRCPTDTARWLAILVTARSNDGADDGAGGAGAGGAGAGGTVTVADALLSLGSGSSWSRDTFAVLVIAPTADALAVTSTCADPPATSEPRAHESLPAVVEHDPWLGSADTSVKPAADREIRHRRALGDGQVRHALKRHAQRLRVVALVGVRGVAGDRRGVADVGA